MNSSPAPIILFVYNRLDHTEKTVRALQRNTLAKESPLFIYSDGPKKGADKKPFENLRAYLKTITGFKKVTIVERQENWGLAKSVIAGVSEIINAFGKAIVVEDDIVTSNQFLAYMNDALSCYETNNKIISISGYTFPIEFPLSDKNETYIFKRASSWGWATWKDQWENVDWEIKDQAEFLSSPKEQKNFNAGGGDLTRMLKKQLNGKIDSWAVRWSYHHYKQNGFCLFPKNTLVQNIGFDETGTHCNDERTGDMFNGEGLSSERINVKCDLTEHHDLIKKELNKIVIPTLITRIKNKLKTILKKVIGY